MLAKRVPDWKKQQSRVVGYLAFWALVREAAEGLSVSKSRSLQMWVSIQVYVVLTRLDMSSLSKSEIIGNLKLVVKSNKYSDATRACIVRWLFWAILLAVWRDELIRDKDLKAPEIQLPTHPWNIQTLDSHSNERTAKMRQWTLVSSIITAALSLLRTKTIECLTISIWPTRIKRT